MTQKPTLWLIPTPLDLGTDHLTLLDQIIPRDTIEQASKIRHWIVENAKTARAVLKRFGEISPLACSLQDMHITELPREVHKKGDAGFNARQLVEQVLKTAQGGDIGLMSEAGLPAIADPGSSVVLAAHQLGMPVRPMIGPSSLLLALMGSGLNGQNFAFTGYLPKPGIEQTKRIKELEKLALQYKQTQLFIETPYRNQGLLDVLIQTLQPQTALSLALGITLPSYTQVTMKVFQWKELGREKINNDILKLPAIFIIGT